MDQLCVDVGYFEQDTARKQRRVRENRVGLYFIESVGYEGSAESCRTKICMKIHLLLLFVTILALVRKQLARISTPVTLRLEGHEKLATFLQTWNRAE